MSFDLLASPFVTFAAFLAFLPASLPDPVEVDLSARLKLNDFGLFLGGGVAASSAEDTSLKD